MSSYVKLYKEKLKEEKMHTDSGRVIEENKVGVNFALLSDWDSIDKDKQKLPQVSTNSNIVYGSVVPNVIKFESPTQETKLNVVPIQSGFNAKTISNKTSSHNVISSINNNTLSLVNKFSSRPPEISNNVQSTVNKEKEIKELNSLRAENTAQINPINYYENYHQVNASNNIQQVENNNNKENDVNSNNIVSSNRANNSFKKDDNDNELHCSIHDDSLNITQQQMEDLNNEVNVLYKEMKDNYKKSNYTKKKQAKNLQPSTKAQNKKAKLEPLLIKQKEIIQKTKRNPSPIMAINNNYQNVNVIQNPTQLPNQIPPYPIQMNPYPYPYQIPVQYPYQMPQQFYPMMMYNNNMMNNQQMSPINNQIEQKKPKREIKYKPKGLKEYKEKYENKSNNYYNLNKLPAGLGPNIGTKDWEEKHQRALKMKEYSKMIDKEKELQKINQIKNNTIEDVPREMKEMLNDSLDEDITDKRTISTKNYKRVSVPRRKIETHHSSKTNPKSKVYTTYKPKEVKLPPIPKSGMSKPKKKEIHKEDEMTKQFMEEKNPELENLLLNHNVYKSKVDKIKEHLYKL